MEYEIKVKARSKKNEVVQSEDGSLTVFVTAPAVDDKANNSVIKLLAKHWGVSKSRVSIIKGLKSKNKVVELSNAW